MGYKRLLRFPAVRSSRIWLTVTNVDELALVSEVGVYKASVGEAVNK